MREILFRGKTYDTGKWVEGCYLTSIVCKDVYGYIMRDGSRCLDTILLSTIGQYTGLTDKNGNKIFEGDIITCSVWHEIGCYPHSETKTIEVKMPEIYTVHFDEISRKVEVIGNIHDNPELLKEGKADV